MDLASALIFPETDPPASSLAGLLLFFGSLAWYRPAETSLTESGLFGGLCQPYVPAPLSGEELRRFKRLVREMETSRPDELSRLFAAASAPMATGQVKDMDETSAAGLYSSLHKNAATRERIRFKEGLWQARIILTLAEIFSQRETEVRQGLARIAAAEKKIIAALEGENRAEPDKPLKDTLSAVSGHHPEDNGMPPAQTQEPAATFIPHRTKAWAQLYLADFSDTQPEILATVSQEYSAPLFEHFEKIQQQAPVKILSLPLPLPAVSDDQKTVTRWMEARQKFRQNSLDCLQFFGRHLVEAAGSSDSEISGPGKNAALESNISVWNENLHQSFGAQANQLRPLDFYCLTGLSFTHVFQDLVRSHSSGSSTSREKQPAIMAVLQSGQKDL